MQQARTQSTPNVRIDMQQTSGQSTPTTTEAETVVNIESLQVPEYTQRAKKKKVSDHWDWDDSEDEETTHAELFEVKKNWICPCCPCWPRLGHWTRTFIKLIVVSLILGTPAIVFGILYLVRASAPGKNAAAFCEFPDDPKSLCWDTEIVRHSVFYVLLYLLWVLCSTLVTSTPFLVLKFSNRFTRGCSEMTKQRLEYVVSLSRYISLLIWMPMVLVAFVIVFWNHNYIPYQRVILNLLYCLLIFVVLYFFEKLIVQLVAIKFHRSAYFDRIADSKYQIYVLDSLRKALPRETIFDDLIGVRPSVDGSLFHWKRVITPTSTPPQSPKLDSQSSQKKIVTEKELSSVAEARDPGSLRRRLTTKSQKGVSMSPTREGSIGRRSGHLTAQAEIEATLERMKESTSAALNSKKFKFESDDVDVNSRKEAKKLAKRLYMALLDARIQRLTGNGSSAASSINSNDTITALGSEHFVTLTDFIPFFDEIEDARKAFTMFDEDDDGTASKSEFKSVILRTYKERKDLIRSMRDVSQAVRKLDSMMFYLAIFITGFASLVILGIFASDSWTAILSLSPLIVAWSFVFGNSLKNFFEGLIWVFVVHAYDSGDRVFIDGQNLIVYKINLLSTVFRRFDGQEVYWPNSQLAQKPVYNIRRSPHQSEIIETYVDLMTPSYKIEQFREAIRMHLASEHKDWYPNLTLNSDLVVVQGLPRLKLLVDVQHRSNWFESSKRWDRRTRLVFKIAETLHKFEIGYTIDSIGFNGPQAQMMNATDNIIPQSSSPQQRQQDIAQQQELMVQQTSLLGAGLLTH